MKPARSNRLTHPAPDRSVQGFSLVELMVTIVILAIGLTIAAPSFSRMVAEQRVRTAASELHNALLFTRSAAITRNAAVDMKANSGDWTKGWTITPASSSTEILREAGELKSVTVSTASTITFGSSGRQSTSVDTIELTSATLTDVKRCITISPSGQVTVKVGECP